jgi:hypothetical protein
MANPFQSDQGDTVADLFLVELSGGNDEPT